MTWKSEPINIKQVKQSGKTSKPITPEQLASSGTEDGLQAAVFCRCAELQAEYPQLLNLFSVPNGGFRSKVEAVKLVATGVRRGVPDFMLAWPSNMSVKKVDTFSLAVNFYNGLFIELKLPMYKTRKNGGRLDDQIKWGARLSEAGYCVRVCYGWEEAVDVILKYLKGEL